MTKEINIIIDKESEEKLGFEAYHYFKETKDAIESGEEVIYTTLSNFLTYDADTLQIWYQGEAIDYTKLIKVIKKGE